MKEISSARVAAIDVFRALTMTLMIFVNDLPSVKGVPHWLGHAEMTEDFLGFSDLIFPAFLVVLGMSIPFALEKRFSRGESRWSITGHIFLRSAALLIMGLYSVNIGSLSPDVIIPRPYFSLLALMSFFLMWNNYPRSTDNKKYLWIGLKVLGIAIIVFLAVIFRNKSGGWLQTSWWGILGLIGWTYLLCALFYLFYRKNIMAHLLVLAGFILLNIAGKSGWLGNFSGIIVDDGAFHVMTMIGLITSLYISQNRESISKSLRIVALCGVLLIIAGYSVRPVWIISKIQATPTWVFISSGIALVMYALIYWITDVKGKSNWFKIISPAGTATLTCYLLPSVVYNLLRIFDISIVTTWPAGVLKPILFSCVIIGFTALLGRIGIKLKI